MSHQGRHYAGEQADRRITSQRLVLQGLWRPDAVSRADVEAAAATLAAVAKPASLLLSCSIERKMPAIVLRNDQQDALGIGLGIAECTPHSLIREICLHHRRSCANCDRPLLVEHRPPQDPNSRPDRLQGNFLHGWPTHRAPVERCAKSARPCQLA
jgi:hypothetical protein